MNRFAVGITFAVIMSQTTFKVDIADLRSKGMETCAFIAWNTAKRLSGHPTPMDMASHLTTFVPKRTGTLFSMIKLTSQFGLLILANMEIMVTSKLNQMGMLLLMIRTISHFGAQEPIISRILNTGVEE